MNRNYLMGLLLGSLWACACSDKEENNVKPSVETYALDETSILGWKGSLLDDSFNNGTIGVESNDIKLEDGNITGGTFTIPVSSIINLNLPEDKKPELVHHLKTPDFFNIAVFPVMTFKLNEVKLEDKEEQRYLVNGKLTLLGQTHDLEFHAQIETPAVGKFHLQGTAIVDRTRWGMTYATDPDGPVAVIKNNIEVTLDLTAVKKL